MMFYILIGLYSLCVWVLWYYKKRSSLEPPEISDQLPLFGVGHRLLGDSVDMYNTVKSLSEECLEKGGVVKMNLGPRMFYFLADPEDCLTTTSLCIKKHYIYDFARPLLANGILNADVPTWKKHRKLLNPAFSQYVLDGFMEIFNSQAQLLVEQFANEVGKPFDHEKYLRINNLETICSTATGVDPDDYGSLQKQYLPHLEEVLHIFNQRIQQFWLHSDFIFNLSPLKRRQDKEMEQLVKLSDSIVEKKKSEKNPTYSESKSAKFKPFMDLILELVEENSSFTDEQIKGETATVIVGGHETTASTLTFAFALLGAHPHVQEKAYEEILHVLGNSDKYVEKDDLSKLVYIEVILKETMRLYPVIPMIARQLDKDIKLKNYTLKADTGCLISIYGIHRHKMWGSDANEFKPERWLDKETIPDPKYYAAFGFGRRSCIGKMYGMMSMKIILAQILRKYRISSDVSKMVVKMDTMIRPISGYHISIEPRNTN